MDNKFLFIETFGCQMNVSDTEIVKSILASDGFRLVDNPEGANVILLNTCSVRDNAEEKVVRKIEALTSAQDFKKKNKILGVIGCMAMRWNMKDKISESSVSFFAGPDEYRKLPELISNSLSNKFQLAVEHNPNELYDDIIPMRVPGVTSSVTIMRGCNNYCSYCVVPLVRGKERSRKPESIITEVINLWQSGFKEVTLLGQTINNYKFAEVDFADLLIKIATELPEMRIRFLTSHPKFFNLKLIDTIAKYKNICKHIHLPLQSGSNEILKNMRRKYSITHYFKLVESIREAIPHCALSTDIITGYPGETKDNHEDTLAAMEFVQFDTAFMFKYSPRENTRAYHKYDDVPEEVKIQRLNQIISLQNKISQKKYANYIGKTCSILVESPSKRNKNEWMGRTDTNKVVIFDNSKMTHKSGELIKVKITSATSATLIGKVVD